MKRVLFSLVLIFFVFYGCGTVSSGADNDQIMKRNEKNRPEWTKGGNVIKKMNEVQFVGAVSGSSSEEEAVSSATAKAFAEVSNYFGVSVESNMVASEQETDGNYTYSLGVTSKLTGSRITVKDYVIKKKFIEKRRSRGTEFDAYILLSVPNREMTRIRIESEGAATIAFLNDHEEIAQEIKKFTKVLAQKKGIKFNKKTIKLSSDYEVSDVLIKVGTAYLMTVNIKEGEPEDHEGEWYVQTKLEVELVSLLSGKIIEVWTTEAKGAAFSREDCRMNGCEQVVRSITEQIK